MARRGGHGAAHGGAWKVAYADLVTSMMALFLVLWLVGSDDESKMAVQRYFKGELMQQGRKGTKDYSAFKPLMTQMTDKASNELVNIQELQRAMERLRDQLKNSSEIGEDLIRFEFQADGMKVIALDRSKKPFFQPGTAELTEFGVFVLNTIALVIERHPFNVEVEGHTQQGGSDLTTGSIWDLSTMRAVNAQRQLLEGGIKSDQFWRVAGYGDRMPLTLNAPDGEENRRITIIVRPRADDNIGEIRERLSAP